MTPTEYLVEITDGPARGFLYTTWIEPDPVITLWWSPHGWVRLLLDPPLHPEAHVYELAVIDSTDRVHRRKYRQVTGAKLAHYHES